MSARRKRFEQEGDFGIPGLGDRNYRPGEVEQTWLRVTILSPPLTYFTPLQFLGLKNKLNLLFSTLNTL